MAQFQQLGAVVRISTEAATPTLTDISSLVRMAKGTITRNTVTSSATYGTPYEAELAGIRKDTFQIEFKDDLAVASFRSILWDVMLTTNSYLFFQARWDPGAISTANPEFRGTGVVLSLDTGWAVNEERYQTLTLPVLSPGITKHTS